MRWWRSRGRRRPCRGSRRSFRSCDSLRAVVFGPRFVSTAPEIPSMPVLTSLAWSFALRRIDSTASRGLLQRRLLVLHGALQLAEARRSRPAVRCGSARAFPRRRPGSSGRASSSSARCRPSGRRWRRWRSVQCRIRRFPFGSSQSGCRRAGPVRGRAGRPCSRPRPVGVSVSRSWPPAAAGCGVRSVVSVGPLAALAADGTALGAAAPRRAPRLRWAAARAGLLAPAGASRGWAALGCWSARGMSARGECRNRWPVRRLAARDALRLFLETADGIPDLRGCPEGGDEAMRWYQKAGLSFVFGHWCVLLCGVALFAVCPERPLGHGADGAVDGRAGAVRQRSVAAGVHAPAGVPRR